MKLPDFGELPKWANYVAMDANGDWWCYEVEPKAKDGMWSSQHGWCLEWVRHGEGWVDSLHRVARETQFIQVMVEE
jgi:hypothetical protein